MLRLRLGTVLGLDFRVRDCVGLRVRGCIGFRVRGCVGFRVFFK